MSSPAATDVHVHFVPARLAGDGSDWRPEIIAHTHGPSGVKLRGREIDAVVQEFSDLDVIQQRSADRGVDKLVVSPWVSLIPAAGSSADAVGVCRIHNQAMAEETAGREDRVAAMAMVPVQHGAAAVEVAEEAMELGLRGVELMATYGGAVLGDASMEDFFAFAAARSIPVFVHPATKGLDMAVFGSHYLWNSVANPMETTMAAASLVTSGVLERNPELSVVLAHGGGALLSVWDRICHSWEVRPEARADLSSSPRESLARLYVDSVVHSPGLLRNLIEKLGAEKILLGSDWPFDMGLDDPVATVASAGLGEKEISAILCGNAKTLYGI